MQSLRPAKSETGILIQKNLVPQPAMLVLALKAKTSSTWKRHIILRFSWSGCVKVLESCLCQRAHLVETIHFLLAAFPYKTFDAKPSVVDLNVYYVFLDGGGNCEFVGLTTSPTAPETVNSTRRLIFIVFSVSLQRCFGTKRWCFSWQCPSPYH